MTRTHRLLIAGGVVAGGCAAAIAWFATRGGDAPTSGQRAGAALAAGIATLAAEAPLEPMPCARLELASTQGERSFVAGKRTFRVTGPELTADDGPKRELVLGVVANARGAHADTLARLPAVRAEFERSGVELVVVAGGMAQRDEELRALLEPLATDAPWALWVIPAGRETPVGVARVAEALGDRVVDGTAVRFATLDGVALGSLPGEPFASRLAAATDGCRYTAADADAMLAALGARDGVTVLVTHAPARQRGPRASDLAEEGIHIGELALAEAIERAPVSLVLHAGAQSPGATAAGEFRGKAPTWHLGAPALDALPSPGLGSGALVVQISKTRQNEPLVRWRRLRFDGAKLRPR